MKILVLVNWDVHRLSDSDVSLQPPNALCQGRNYWFFKYWPDSTAKIDVVDWCNVPVVHFLERKLLKFYVVQTLVTLPRLKEYDLVISHGAQSGVLLAFLRSIAGRHSPPHAIIDVGSLNGARARGLELRPIRYALKSVGCVIYHARAQQEYYRTCLPSVLHCSRFVPFGTDPEFFQPMEASPGNYIICVGYKRRDWRTLIEAYNTLETDAELWIVGTRNVGMPELPRGVRCIPFVPIQELKRMIAASRFVVVPLPQYNFSYGQMTVLQAMAMQKAVITTRVPGVEDYVADGEDGLLVRPYDISDMAEKMAMLLVDSGYVSRMGRLARTSVETRFNEQEMARGMYKAIGETCGQ